MGYRSVFIQSAARISVRQQQLVILTDAERHLPLEDVDCLLLEDPRSTLTAAALACCMDSDNPTGKRPGIRELLPICLNKRLIFFALLALVQ